MLGLFNAKVISKGRYGRTREVKVGIHVSSLAKLRDLLESSLGFQ